jgi:hypothetical protein
VRCEAAELELSARLDGAPDHRKDADLDAHLATCASCRSFEARAMRLRDAVRREAAAPVPDLVGAIMAAVDAQPARPLRALRTGRRTAFVAMASVAALAIVALAVAVTRPSEVERRTEAIRILRTRTLLAWTPGQVPGGLADAIASLPGVSGVARVRSGVVWMNGWTDSSGRKHTPPAGMRIPVEVAGIDPASYARFVPGAERAILSRLDRGNVVMGDGGAKLRDISRTGSLTFGRTRLAVDGVIDDALVGAHEAVVSLATAHALSIDRVRYLLVAVSDEASVDDVSAGIRGAVTNDDPIRVRALGDAPYLRHGDAVLPQVRVKERFGEFAAADAPGGFLRVDPAWTKANIVTARVPYLGTVRCHRLIVPQLRAAFDEISRDGLGGTIRRGDFGGCFFPRYLSQDAGAGISHHSWGIAFDINVNENAFGKPPQLDPRVVDVIERWGFTWGGRWLVPDGMHFEFVRTVRGPG